MALIVRKNDVDFSLNKKENIYIGFNKNLETKKVGLYYAKLVPGQKLKMHTHNRPENGDEIFFFYKKGRVMLGFEKDGAFVEEIVDVVEPMHILIGQNEKHSIENIGDTDFEFEVLCAPKFEEGETTVLGD